MPSGTDWLPGRLAQQSHGEARAHVTVSAQVSITNAQNETLYSGTQQATTNDFGILSLTVGDENTFRDVDFGKLPFFISVSVDGTLISKSQILHVPVAEAAKTLVGELTKDKLVGTWSMDSYEHNSPYHIGQLTFNKDGTCVLKYDYTSNGEYLGFDEYTGTYQIQGNIVLCNTTCTYSHGGSYYIGSAQNHILFHKNNKLYREKMDIYTKK